MTHIILAGKTFTFIKEHLMINLAIDELTVLSNTLGSIMMIN
uniref:Uncharacterized protein n=1 Tax=Rhizophora mucronata TaxID=61149 RepID=A0A2P2NER9_RHIMU